MRILRDGVDGVAVATTPGSSFDSWPLSHAMQEYYYQDAQVRRSERPSTR
jgi:hypothetical protein